MSSAFYITRVKKHFCVPRPCPLIDVTATVPSSFFMAQTSAGIFKEKRELCKRRWIVDGITVNGVNCVLPKDVEVLAPRTSKCTLLVNRIFADDKLG